MLELKIIAAISAGKILGIAAINVIAIILAIKGHRVSAWGIWALAVLLCVIG